MPSIGQIVANLRGINFNDEIEVYILTPEEEGNAIIREIQLSKNTFQYKRLELGEKLQDIQLKSSLIEWNDMVDIDAIKKRYNANKLRDIYFKEQIKQENIEKVKKVQENLATYTAGYFYKLMAWTSRNVYRKDLIYNVQTEPLIKVFCYFLSKDPRFETELGYSLKKGLLIRGTPGLGKTFLIECVKDNPYQKIGLISTVDISLVIKKEGEYDLTFNPSGIIYLDDVGSEQPTVNHYGTKINFVKEYLELFYFKNKDFNKLMISTNISIDELEEKYGARVRSRMKDMFNLIDIFGQDLRG